MTDQASQELTNRVNDLEARAAHYERMAEELSEVIAAQAAQIDRLIRQLRKLSEQVMSHHERWEPSPQDSEPPPHY